jgi:hypothetical protein
MGAVPGAPGGGYPVQVTFDEDQELNRLWGIPILGYVVRWLALIPHLFVLTFVYIVVGLTILISWLLVLLTGTQPLAGLYASAIRYAAQVSAWAFFLVGPYPAFLGGDDYPVRVEMPTEGHLSRLWGIPYFGLLVRALVLIPHFIVAFFFAIAAYLFAFVLWIPILLNGRPPRLAYATYGALIRLQVRIYAWYLLCAVPYPPIVP